MACRLQDLRALAPNARQMYEYTGESGFTEARFSAGRGRSDFVMITTLYELKRFLRDGDFSKFSCCRVLLPGQRIKQKAHVLVKDDHVELVADNGMVITKISTAVH